MNLTSSLKFIDLYQKPIGILFILQHADYFLQQKQAFGRGFYFILSKHMPSGF